MDLQTQILHFLYNTKPGRFILKPLINPAVSKLAGVFLDTHLSTALISGFIRNNHIDMNQYEPKDYVSYNDFFTRKIKPDKRSICFVPDALIAPCDAKLSVYPIQSTSVFTIKHREYTLKELLKNEKLAERYQDGWLFLFRLTVDDYHRYCYVDDGQKSDNYHIPGVFHTVNPIANDHYPIYRENTREFSLLKSEHFGTILMMEVGALLVGRIVNHDQASIVKRGDEKGFFEFGGSTIILCIQKDQLQPSSELIHNTELGLETVVKMGSVIGYSK